MSGAPLSRACLLRWVPAVAYVLAAGLVTGLVMCHTPPGPPLATQALSRNHKIAPADLETTATAALVGRYLKQDVGKAEAVTPSMVSRKELPPGLTGAAENVLAAVIKVPATVREERKMEVGSTVEICRDGRALGFASKVIVTDCDEQVCAVVVALPQGKTQAFDPAVLAGADLVPPDLVPLHCSGAKP